MAGISFEEALGAEPSKSPTKGISFEEATSGKVPSNKSIAAAKQTTLQPSQPTTTSGLGTFIREAGLNVPATMAGIGAGEAATVAAAPFMGPAAPLAGLVAGGAVGFGVNYLGESGLNALEGMDPLAQRFMKMMGVDKATREAGRKEHEYFALGGQLASGGPFMSTAAKNIGQRVVGGGINVGVGAGSRAAFGEDQDIKKSAMEFGAGFAMPGTLSKTGERIPGVRKTEPVTTEVKKPITPEEQAEFVKKLEAKKLERDSKAPLVEAAIRNKSTGEIERMGPKHDQARKEATKDTHEEGFVDERGNFHERQIAVDQAKRAGQIPEDHVLENPPGERPGLHSGDLRKVGDERFAITEDQPAGVPKEPKATRADFKEAIDVNEAKRMGLEAQAEEAARVGDEARVTSINEQIKVLEQEHAQLTKDMPSQETLAYERSDVQEYADRHSTTTESTKDAFVDWLHKSEMPLNPAKIGEYEKQFMADIETPKEKIITSSPDKPTTTLKDGSKISISTVSTPDAFSNIVRMQHGEPISLVAKNEAGEEVGRLTYMPDGGPIDVSVREQDRRKGVATALYDAHEAAGGKLPAKDSGVVISDEARAVRESRDAAKKLSTDTTPVVAKEFEKLDPRSMPSEEAMLNHATDIYERYGEADAIKFFDNYKKNLDERSIPIPNNEQQLDDGMHKMNTFATKDESEHVIGYEESTKAGVTEEDRAKAFMDKEENKTIGGKLGEILQGIWDENLALVRKIRAMGGDVGEEFLTGQSRTRLWSEKEKPGWKETLKKFFSNDSPMGDKVADQADAAIERKVFQTDDGRVIELHRFPEDTLVPIKEKGKLTGTRSVKKGTEIVEWKDGDKRIIGHSDNVQLKRGDKFTGKDGKEATIVDGKVSNIESNSPYRYLHDAEASARIANMGLRKMARELEYVQNLKKSELFKRVGHSPDQPLKDLPRNWIVPSNIDRIPELRGWHFDPKTAAIISDFAKVWDDTMYMKLSNALVKNMMLNPIPHMFNEVMHLWNARGFSGWVDPRRLGMFADTARVAWRDVGNQTQFYRDIMREGGSILGASPRNKGYFDNIQKEASKQMFGTPEMKKNMAGLAKKLGTSVGDLYNGISESSQKAMWFTRDVMYVQLIREIMARQEKSGNKMTLKEAIDRAERHMPNYRLPSEVLGSRAVSQVLRDPRISMFSRYHYGMVKSLVNTIKDVNPNNLKTPEGRAHFREGVDSMLAIGVAMGVMYPLMDAMAEAVFGEGAEQRRAGPYHLLQAGLDFTTGKKDASALIWPVFTFNPVALTLGQLGLNKKIFTGKEIYHPDDDFMDKASDVAGYAAGQIPQASPLMSAAAEEGGATKFLARQLDIKAKTPEQIAREERAKARQERVKKGRDTKREKGTYKP